MLRRNHCRNHSATTANTLTTAAMPTHTTTHRAPRTPHTATATAQRTALAALALASTLVWLPAQAASTSVATSSASSTSVGSSSDSLGASSDSASPKQRVAQGTYTVVAMAEVGNVAALGDAPHRAPQRAQVQVQLRLQAAHATPGAPATEWLLTLPRDTVARTQLALGQPLLVQHRPYGIALSLPTPDAAGPQPPFFLVLDDTWHRELDSQAVGS